MAETKLETVKHQHPVGHLYSLREQIAGLWVVKCRMSHEQVMRAGELMLPVICRFSEGNYERVGLCEPELRAKRLACSHTSARIKLKDAINELNSRDEEGNTLGPLLSSELNWLDNQIHLLDHRRGEAEKRLARILEDSCRGGSGRKDQELVEAENRIQELERAHDEYVERIGRLRDRIITKIDKLIEQSREPKLKKGIQRLLILTLDEEIVARLMQLFGYFTLRVRLKLLTILGKSWCG